MEIIDFGLSDSDAFFILKHPAGTTGFIAPEQFMPDAKAEPRTDIFSNKKKPLWSITSKEIALTIVATKLGMFNSGIHIN